MIGEGVITCRGFIFFRIGVVNPIDLRAFQQRVAAHFRGTKRSGGVGGEIRAADAARENRYNPALEMADRAAADIRLAHLIHFNGRHDAGFNAHLVENILNGEAVENRRQHAHVIGA